MQAHQPEIKRIQEKYKDDRQRLQRELMEFYRENKINPLASCVPLLLQLPVFFALFSLLRSNEFNQEINAAGSNPDFLGVTLDEKATGAALVILIALYFVTMVGSTSIMASSAEGNQRLMMYALPVVFTPVRDQLSGRAGGLLDHHQPVDDGAAVGGEAGDPGTAEADRGGGEGDQAAPAPAPEAQETPALRLAPRSDPPSPGSLNRLARCRPMAPSACPTTR